MIADFKSTFEGNSDELSYIYKNFKDKLDNKYKNIFSSRQIQISQKLPNGETVLPVSNPITFEELEFDTKEIPSNKEWKPTTISGEFVNYKWVVGNILSDMVSNVCKIE